MQKKIWRSKIVVTVLSDTELPAYVHLSEIENQIDCGDMVGQFGVESSEELSGKDAADACYDVGSEPGFFQMDDEGNDLSQDDSTTEESGT